MGVYEPLPDFKTAEMPERKLGFWKMAGPGAILVGLSIGAGEIIIWPRIAAEYGASMIWAAVAGVFLQLWINLEIGRWTIATGETVYTGYARVCRCFVPIFILLNFLAWIAPGWALGSGLALKALVVGPQGWGSNTFWTGVTFVGVAILLFGPKVAYQSVEKTVEILVALVTVGLIVVAIRVGTTEIWGDMAKGIVNIGYIDPKMGIKPFFIALVFAGAGGTANIFYSYYLRDKHIGMGAHLPSMQNPLRGRTEKIPATGYQYEESETNEKRFRAWWDYLKKDQLLFFWGLNTITILLFIFGALAVLHPKGIVPERGTLIFDEAQILGEVWGKTGTTIFLLVGVATLFSTQLGLVDGVARTLSDLIYTNFKGAQKRDIGWWYLVIAGTWIVAGTVIIYISENMENKISELDFLFSAAYMGGFAMAIYVPMTLYINHKFLPKSARPGAICTIMMIVASLVYVGFAGACLLGELGIVSF